MWRIEEQEALDLYIKPIIMTMELGLLLPFNNFVKRAPRDKYGGCLPTLLAELPAIHNHIEVMYRNSEDPNRKDKVNDTFDLELMPVPLAYADAFLSLDRWIRDRFVKPGGFKTRNNCEPFSTYAELEGWLDKA